MIAKNYARLWAILSLLLLSKVHAAVLDDDRLDIAYQVYGGGGVRIEAPTLIVRKKMAETVAISAEYLVDKISGASIDVEVGASSYEEERTEYGLGIEYLHNKSVLKLGYSNSSENDYDAETVYLNVSQDFFGDLSTFSMGLALGSDDVGKTGDPAFSETAKHYKMDVGLTQVLTKQMIASIAFNKTVDEGYLQNPYRTIRFLDSTDLTNFIVGQEEFPDTRSSDAWSLNLRYLVVPGHAVYGGNRFYQDTWGIKAFNVELGYVFRVEQKWIIDLKWRYYEQAAADFYSDLFEFEDQSNFRGRDKELSQFSNSTFSASVSYDFDAASWGFIKRSSIHVFYDYMTFEYDDFRDLRVDGVSPGQEPLYKQDANILRIMYSVFY